MAFKLCEGSLTTLLSGCAEIKANNKIHGISNVTYEICVLILFCIPTLLIHQENT